MTHHFRDRYAIVGVGISPTTRTGAEGRSAQQLDAWAVRSAIVDAGLHRADIDGAVHAAAQFGSDAYSRKLGLSSNFYYPIGRMAGAVAGVFFATQALATGNARYVAVSLGLSWLTQSREAECGPANSGPGSAQPGLATVYLPRRARGAGLFPDAIEKRIGDCDVWRHVFGDNPSRQWSSTASLELVRIVRHLQVFGIGTHRRPGTPAQ